jgi:hypothetical protein
MCAAPPAALSLRPRPRPAPVICKRHLQTSSANVICTRHRHPSWGPVRRRPRRCAICPIGRSEGWLTIRRARLERASTRLSARHVQTVHRETPAASAIMLTSQPSARRCAIRSRTHVRHTCPARMGSSWRCGTGSRASLKGPRGWLRHTRLPWICSREQPAPTPTSPARRRPGGMIISDAHVWRKRLVLVRSHTACR